MLYLFGTPGQERFWFMWNDLVNGALGAVVLADTRRLDVSFASIDFFESRGIPFVVGVNCFHGVTDRTAEEIREALDLDPHVPLVLCDARDRDGGPRCAAGAHRPPDGRPVRLHTASRAVIVQRPLAAHQPAHVVAPSPSCLL